MSSRTASSVVPQVSGQIASVAVGENEPVAAGQTLFTLDDATYRNAVEEAEARLASARLEVERLKAAYAQAASEADTARDSLATAQTQDDRQQTLLKSGVVSQSAADDSALKLQVAKGTLVSAESAVASARAALAGNPDIDTDAHPQVLQALAALHAAELDLARTVVTAPAAGVISQTDRLQVGQYVTPAIAVVSLVATDDTWIEANYKETELTHMQPGQPVSVHVDTYRRPRARGHRRARSAPAPARSSRCCRPQNATGNWVKVVQRVPVRIELDAGQDVPTLRAGMSVAVEVDTGHARGLPAFASAARRRRPRRRRRRAAAARRTGASHERGNAAAGPAVANKGLITVAIMLATIMQVLDTTIANVALPNMQGSLGAAQDQITWVLTSYIVAAAIMTPVTGWLADRFGRRELFIASTAGFVVASMACGFATSLEEMILFRVLQGIFGAALVPLSPDRAARHQPEGGAWPGDGDLGRRHHGRPDHRPDARRLADRDLQLALRVLRQPAGRRTGARRPDRLPAEVAAPRSAASTSSASPCSRSPSARCS